ncbi:MAG TPA: MFS transporter [Halanaerobiales bacterium]|nr:MFS transporter [Halanaerobiales bacterium]
MQDNQSSNNEFNWKVLMIITAAGFFAGVYRNGIMTLFPFLQAEFDLTRAQVGLYSTFLFISMAVVVLFSGRIADYFGVKRSIFWGLSFMGVFITLHSLANGFILLMLFAMLNGLGLSIILPSTSKAVAEWFRGDNQATAMGIMTMGFALGGVAGASVLPWLGVQLGWKMLVIILGGLFLIVGAVFYFTYQDKNNNSDQVKKDSNNSFLKNIGLFFNNKYLVLLCVLGIIFGAVSGVVVTHFSFFLFTDYNFSEVTAGLGFMVLQVGSMVGRTGWGYLNGKLLGGVERRGFFIVGILMSLVSLAFAFLSNFNPALPIIMVLAFLLGATGRGWHGLYFSEVSDQVGEEKAGMGIGLSLLFIRIGIIVGPPIFGYIADRTGTYAYSWLLLGITSLVSVVTLNYFLSKYHKDRERAYKRA